MTEELTDESWMPFGKYMGPYGREPKKMKDVPAKYLFWLWNAGLHEWRNPNTPSGRVRDYIITNIRALQQDDPDAILDHPEKLRR